MMNHLYFGEVKELIDWEDEGFEIVGSAADGEEALLFLAESRCRSYSF